MRLCRHHLLAAAALRSSSWRVVCGESIGADLSTTLENMSKHGNATMSRKTELWKMEPCDNGDEVFRQARKYLPSRFSFLLDILSRLHRHFALASQTNHLLLPLLPCRKSPINFAANCSCRSGFCSGSTRARPDPGYRRYPDPFRRCHGCVRNRFIFLIVLQEREAQVLRCLNFIAPQRPPSTGHVPGPNCGARVGCHPIRTADALGCRCASRVSLRAFRFVHKDCVACRAMKSFAGLLFH